MHGPDTAPIRVACAADAAYVMPLAVAVHSLLAHTPQPVELFVLDGGIPAADRARLLRSWRSDNLVAHWIGVDSSALASLPTWGRMRVPTYHRLLAARHLPERLRRVIWLDTDLVVRADIARLWSQPVSPHALLAVRDLVVPSVSSRYGVAAYRELGLAPDTPYFNAGVMLLDLDVWRNDGVGEQALEHLRRFAASIFFFDQEALNVVLAGRWGELDPRWNQIAGVSGRAFFERPGHLDERAYRRVVLDPWIVHYAGLLKPWVCRLGSRCFDLFFEHLDRTAWAGWRPPPTPVSLFLGAYERWLRDYLYPLEPLVLKYMRRRTRRQVMPDQPSIPEER